MFSNSKLFDISNICMSVSPQFNSTNLGHLDIFNVEIDACSQSNFFNSWLFDKSMLEINHKFLKISCCKLLLLDRF